jgi:hypothetical protein
VSKKGIEEVLGFPNYITDEFYEHVSIFILLG